MYLFLAESAKKDEYKQCQWSRYLKTVLILLLGVIAALMLEYYYYNNQSKDVILDIYPNKPIILK
jgi:hypothetical protein